jgi:hypothetical protein
LAQGTPQLLLLSSVKIWNYYDIPYCAHQANGYQLLDKKNYPYVMTMQNVNEYPAFEKILNYLGAQRLAIIAGPDFDGGPIPEATYQLKRHLLRKGFDVIAYTTVPYRIEAPKHEVDLDIFFDLVKRLDVKYFILYAWPETVADVYFRAKDAGLIGPNYFWMGDVVPSSGTEASLNDKFGANATQDLIGYTYIFPDIALKGSQKFYNISLNRQNILHKLNPDRYLPIGFNSRSATSAFDCTMTLLYGLDRLLKGNASVENLITLFSSFTNPTPQLFSNTGT